VELQAVVGGPLGEVELEQEVPGERRVVAAELEADVGLDFGELLEGRSSSAFDRRGGGCRRR
jgi:hypothetical protein